MGVHGVGEDIAEGTDYVPASVLAAGAHPQIVHILTSYYHHFRMFIALHNCHDLSNRNDGFDFVLFDDPYRLDSDKEGGLEGFLVVVNGSQSAEEKGCVNWMVLSMRICWYLSYDYVLNTPSSS